MSKDKARVIRDRLAKTLKELEKELEVSIHLSNMRYSDTDARISLTFTYSSETGVVQSFEETQFKQHAASLGLAGLSIGDTICIKNVNYTLIGLNSRNRKYPVLISSAGTTYKIAVAQALACVKK